MGKDRPAWMKRYNDTPPNAKQITSDEFWRNFTQLAHVYKFETYYCVNIPGRTNKLIRSFHGRELKVWYHEAAKQGVGFVPKVEKALLVTPDTFFSFAACIHKMTSVRLGRSYTKHSCEKCGYSYEIDSSG